MKADRWHYQPDPRRGMYQFLTIQAGDNAIQVVESPTGRSVQVYVNNEKVWPPGEPS